MRIDKNNDNVIITLEKFSSEIFDQLKAEVLKHDDKNIILNLKHTPLNHEKFLKLMISISEEHKFNNQSFVIVTNTISIEEELDIVPTLQEAYDYIEMEQIERDLGIDS